MDAVEYTKTLRRLCESQANCPECPLHENCEEDNYGYCNGNASEYVEKSVHIVEQWAKDHPVKTRQSEFDAVAVYEIDIMPTIDQESLRTTARWKHGGIDGNSYTVNWICRKCGKVADFDYKYCPNCGARMEGRRDE